MGTLSAAIKSKLCYLLILCITCTAIAVLNDKLLLLLVPLLFGLIFFKSLAFEILLVDHIMEASIGYFDWYNCVDDNLYLGALPLQHQDLDRLPNQLGIKAVLSLVQRFELETSTVGGNAVTPQQWQERGITQMIIETPDFYPPSFECLDKAAAFLNSQLIQGNKCYCHCKSGKGRSASAVMAYFMRYRGDDVATAFAKMKIARPVVFNHNSSQMKNMTAYAEYLRKGKDASR
jgi:atypical dual specificity phosphatase